jgi:hypothetical protein
MTLAQILTAIVSFLQARLTSLRGHVVTLKSQVGSLSQTVTDGLAARFTKTESDARYLGKTDVAANSDKVGGKTLAQIEAQRDSAILLAKNEVYLLAKHNVRKAFRYTIQNGVAFAVGAVVDIANLDDGTYQVFFDGTSTASADGTFYDGTGNQYTQATSNGDVYIFNVSEGNVTDGIFVNNENNIKFNAIQAEQEIQDGRLTDLEASINGLDGTWATDASVKEEIRLAFDAFRIELLGMDYTDIPN